MKHMKTLIFILFTFYTTVSGEPLKTEKKPADCTTITGKATYYANKFHGRKTSNGERFSNDKLTAAHLKLPFGTLVTVTNLDNGISVEVRINDRGPHSKYFIIDISQAAAKQIGIYGKGVGNVELSYILPEEDLSE